MLIKTDKTLYSIDSSFDRTVRKCYKFNAMRNNDKRLKYAELIS